MKKMKFFAMALAAMTMVAGFSSCNKDDEDETAAATITIQFDRNATFEEGDNVTGSIVSAQEDLNKVVILKDDNAVKTITDFSKLPVLKGASGLYQVMIDGLSAGNYKLRATSKTGESTKAFTVTSDSIITGDDLGAATAFEWKRIGSAAGTGLSTYGLKWTSNLKATYAVIVKDNATKLVKLNSSNWTSITTKEALKTAIDNATDLGANGYRGVSTSASNTYDDVLGTIVGNTYYMIHVTNATVVTGSSTTVTITGQSKN